LGIGEVGRWGDGELTGPWWGLGAVGRWGTHRPPRPTGSGVMGQWGDGEMGSV